MEGASGSVPRAGEPRVAVIGAGTMGAGIAQVAAMSGSPTALQDVAEAQLERAREAIRGMLEKGVARGKVTPELRDATWGRLSFTTSLAAAVGEAGVVIEAVPESTELKEAIFREVDALAGPEAILASNTSSLSITRLASVTRRPERFLGMHFFNPVPIMKLLELVAGRETSEETIAAGRALGEQFGKTVIVVRDSPGFATSRLGLALGLEAMRMVEEGVASPEDIDAAMTLGYGHPMGPLRLTDLIGLDVRLQIARYLHGELGEDRFRPPRILEEMVREGRLGRKSGRGFYDWSEGTP